MKTALPLPAAAPISANQAGAIARRGRKLLRRGEITHREAALLDCLLWSCRKPGQGAVSVPITTLCRLARVCRETVVAGLRRLAELGVLRIVKRRFRVAWFGRAVASRQAVSAYVLLPPTAGANTESGAPTVKTELDFSVCTEPSAEALEAQKHLDLRAAVVLQQLREAHRKRLEGMQAFNHHPGATLA